MHEDLEKILIHERTILTRCDELAAQITEEYRGRDLTVVAVLSGALMFVADLLRRVPLPLEFDCINAASYHGGTQSTGNVVLEPFNTSHLNGRHLLIVDDILDTGETLHAIREKLLLEAKPASVKICVLLRKKKTRAKPVTADYTGFDIEDEFVVGYGLDFQEHYRNLPFIGVLKK